MAERGVLRAERAGFAEVVVAMAGVQTNDSGWTMGNEGEVSGVSGNEPFAPRWRVGRRRRYLGAMGGGVLLFGVEGGPGTRGAWQAAVWESSLFWMRALRERLLQVQHHRHHLGTPEQGVKGCPVHASKQPPTCLARRPVAAPDDSALPAALQLPTAWAPGWLRAKSRPGCC